MKRSPTISELDESPEYKKVLTLKYDEIAIFVVNRLFCRSFIIISFWLFTLLALGINIFYWIKLNAISEHPSSLVISLAGYIIIPLALAPFHEGLHWLFLKLTGSKDTRLGMDLSQGIIYISSHRHVIRRSQFTIIALAPFVFISAALITMILSIDTAWVPVFLSSVLFTHTTMCSGDIILMSYMYETSASEAYTWDDVNVKESYFYIRNS